MVRLAVALWLPSDVVAVLSALDRPAVTGVRVPREPAGQPVRAPLVARSVTLVADRSSPHGARFDDLAVIPLGESDARPA